MRETMALRATDEPRLIRLITTPKRKETMTALRGMGKLGETYGQSARIQRPVLATRSCDRGRRRVADGITHL